MTNRRESLRPTMLLFIYLQCILVLTEATIGDFEKNQGAHAAARLCGMDGNDCMDDFNCCQEYFCNDERVCELMQAPNHNPPIENLPCTTDWECPQRACCIRNRHGGRCSRHCSHFTEPKVVPAGGYYGQQFWNLWTRKRQMDHRF